MDSKGPEGEVEREKEEQGIKREGEREEAHKDQGRRREDHQGQALSC